ncbi:MAG: response regulator [Gammaproteobacteria bacterium]|jgi:two-component system nitrate/nitrite response regulator NarL
MRILLIDDHTLFRMGLEELLERRGIEVAASVGDGYEGCRLAAELNPDVILLDLRMPDMDGLAVLNRLRTMGLTIPVVMLTTSSEERDLVQSLRSGAKGYLLKDMEPDALLSSLQEILLGKTVVASDMTAVLAKVVQGDVSAVRLQSGFGELTPREMEILCHLAEGQSNKVIARELGISDGTVKLHVKSILRKLRVHSRVEAAVLAVEQGLCHKVSTP